MAVTKIRRISSWVLILCAVITVVILALFFFGGDGELVKGELWNPIYTGAFLYWMYILFGVTAAATVFFGIWQFIENFKTNPKGSLMGLGVVVVFAAMLFITYSIGDTTPLPIMNVDAQAYNVPFWLKISDMWLYSTYILITLAILGVIAGSIKKILDK